MDQQIGVNNGERGLKAKIRLDFKGTSRPGRFFFGGKPVEKVAEENREHQVAVFRNVPIQGVQIEDIDMSIEVYTVYDELNNVEVAFAPVVLTVTADTLEDMIQFIIREDFRKIEILRPAAVQLSKNDIERLLFKVHEELKEYISLLERKFNLR